jgi:manganese/zinc/iron transport system substrate-binding protein
MGKGKLGYHRGRVLAIVSALAANYLLSGGVAEAKVQVATTIGMVADLVRQVGGERVEVEQLMGPGVDPHLYKPTSTDAARLSKADVIFYSGLMLEGRMGDLFAKLARSGKRVYPTTESVPEELLTEPKEFAGHYDPHIWFDVSMWAQTVPTIVKGLSEVDPEGKTTYENNGAALADRLNTLHQWCKDTIAQLPENQAYGFQVIGLQGVSTVSEAALADMANLVDFIKKQNVKAIFVETSVNPAAIRRVSEDAGVKIGGELYSDAMGNPGEMRKGFDTGTYDGMVRYNVTTIVEALK